MTTPIENCYNISQLSTMEICGKMWSEMHLKRMIISQNLKERGHGRKGSLLYHIDDVKVAIQTYLENKKRMPESSNKESLAALREKKLLKEIEMLKANIARADTNNEISSIELENIKKSSISTREVKEFLMFRYGVENAMLRQILFVNAPIELEGLDISKKRDLCESYYNMIQDVMHETLVAWQEKCLNDEDIGEWPEKINRVINELNKKLNEQNSTTNNPAS